MGSEHGEGLPSRGHDRAIWARSTSSDGQNGDPLRLGTEAWSVPIGPGIDANDRNYLSRFLLYN